MKYLPLLNLYLTHTYHTDGRCPDFRIEPGCKVSRPTIEATFRDLLITLAARNVTPGEYWD